MGSGEQDYLTQLYGAPAPLNLTYSSNYYGSVVDIGQYRRWLRQDALKLQYDFLKFFSIFNKKKLNLRSRFIAKS
jgi:hypothetical protein